jgi:hypothetical protein
MVMHVGAVTFINFHYYMLINKEVIPKQMGLLSLFQVQ